MRMRMRDKQYHPICPSMHQCENALQVLKP